MMAEEEKKERLMPVVITVLASLVIVAGVVAFLIKQRIDKTVNAELGLGKSYYEKGEYVLAKDFFSGIVKNHPRSKYASAARYNRGLCYKELGELFEAEKEWTKIITDYRRSEYLDEAYYEFGLLQESKGNYKEAVDNYQKVIKKSPESNMVPYSLLGIGSTYEKEGLLDKAKEVYKKVLGQYPQGKVASLAQKKLGDVNIKLIFSPYHTEGSFIYEVRPGDTLIGIARKFKTTVALIKECNNLTSNLLRPNKVLKIVKRDYRIVVSKSKNTLILKTKEGEKIKIYTVATGKHNNTPVGEFKVVSKIENPTWYSEEGVFPPGNPKNILGVRWIGISKPGYGIHGTTDPSSLGKQSTRGCIRMLNEEVTELYKLVTPGTPVIIKD
jgi:TolA-binding protein/LysM repeat protein